METDDLPETAEHPGPQVGTPNRRWMLAGSIIAALFGLLWLARACEAQTAPTPWTYGGFADLGYLFAPNDPPNGVFRSRGTAWHLNDFVVNMAGVYVRRPASTDARWGGEVTLHSGKDDEIFGFSATAPNLAGSDWLRHLGPTNVSHFIDVGKGLTIQGGIFSSLIGYDSLYARDNFNYTRPWGADFTPYLMLGVNASYPVSDKLTATGFVVNGYWHLADANHVPSSGAQLAYTATPQLTIKETVLTGPHQSTTSFGYWRVIADTIVEHRRDRLIAALNYHFATERVDQAGQPRAWWMAAQLPLQWKAADAWRIAVRPEMAWDSAGRWTLAGQTVAALTTTVEYRRSYRSLGTSLRLEHRIDRSTGPQGGFFTDHEISPGVPSLTPNQQLLILGLIVRFDGVTR